MKILFIAPIPPPITGHSLVSKVLLDGLTPYHQVDVEDLSKDSFKEGIDGIGRIMQVLGIIKNVWKKKKQKEIIYLTISESFAGNIKDLLIYTVCFKRLDRVYIHLHGGSIKRQLWDHNRALHSINKFFIRRFAGVVISGRSHLQIFDTILPAAKIHIVPNFAQDFLFVSPTDVQRKFERMPPVRILYMSNLIPKKGYNELADAFLQMDEETQKKVCIDFAGGFDSEERKQEFLQKIAGYGQVTYHGIVSNEKKQELFLNAHIFCLPTAYFEGQPVSILEAYASGCVVVTTGQPGILDIFENKTNGFLIEPQSPVSIEEVIMKCIQDKEILQQIGMSNMLAAKEKYRAEIYVNGVRSILEQQHSH